MAVANNLLINVCVMRCNEERLNCDTLFSLFNI